MPSPNADAFLLYHKLFKVPKLIHLFRTPGSRANTEEYFLALEVGWELQRGRIAVDQG
jgi:hypothetical protein